MKKADVKAVLTGEVTIDHARTAIAITQRIWQRVAREHMEAASVQFR